MDKIIMQTLAKELEEYISSYYKKNGIRLSVSDALFLLSNDKPSLSDSESSGDLNIHLCGISEISDLLDRSHALLSPSVPASYDEDSCFMVGQDVSASLFNAGMSMDSHKASFFRVLIQLFGSSDVTADDTSFRLEQGDVVILSPETPFAFSLAENGRAVSVNVRCSTFAAQFGNALSGSDALSAFFRDSIYGSGKANYLRFSTDFSDIKLTDLLYSLIRESVSREPLANMCAISFTKILFARLLRLYGSSISSLRKPRESATRADIGAILQYIQQNYRTVRLSSVAQEFHYNETYLSRMFQGHMGESFIEVVRDIKMLHAEDYLKNSGLRVHEIAAMVGYDSVDHFSRTFKATHNMSPQAFRRISLNKSLSDTKKRKKIKE